MRIYDNKNSSCKKTIVVIVAVFSLAPQFSDFISLFLSRKKHDFNGGQFCSLSSFALSYFPLSTVTFLRYMTINCCFSQLQKQIPIFLPLVFFQENNDFSFSIHSSLNCPPKKKLLKVSTFFSSFLSDCMAALLFNSKLVQI